MRKRTLRSSVLVFLALLLAQIPQPGAESRAAQGPATDEPARAMAAIDRYCAGCHNSRAATPATASGLVLDRADLNRIADDPGMWEKVVRKLRTGAMPPDGAARPDGETGEALAGFIESRLDRAALERPNPDRRGGFPACGRFRQRLRQYRRRAQPLPGAA